MVILPFPLSAILLVAYLAKGKDCDRKKRQATQQVGAQAEPQATGAQGPAKESKER